MVSHAHSSFLLPPSPIIFVFAALPMSFLTGLIKPLAYVSLPFIILRSIAESSPFARYYIRVVLYYSTLGLASAWGMIVAVGMSLAGRRFDINWVVARSFYIMASRVLDIKFIVEGEEHLDTKPAILIGNHQSVLDILYLGRFVIIHFRTFTEITLTFPTLEFFQNMRLSWPRRSCNGHLYSEDSCPFPVLFSSTEETTRKQFAL